MLFSVLVNIDQQKKVMKNCCYVSKNIIFSKLNTEFLLSVFLSILDHFQVMFPLIVDPLFMSVPLERRAVSC